jgi:hypothetical protein
MIMETKLTKHEIELLKLLDDGNRIGINELARRANIRTGIGFYDVVNMRWASYQKFVKAGLVNVEQYDHGMYTGHISISGRMLARNS